MEVAWKIDVLTDSGERSSRMLHCFTEELTDPIARYQIEMLTHLGFQRNQKLKRFRSLFTERIEGPPRGTQFTCLFIDDYWEDSVGKEISKSQAWETLFGIPKGLLRLISTEPHYINLQVRLANGEPAFGKNVPTLSAHQQFILRHFTLDAMELHKSRFMTMQSPFSISGPIGGQLELRTIGSEHIGHFVSVFRRLYADKEKANFEKMCDVVHMTFQGTLFSDWLAEDRKSLTTRLGSAVQSLFAQNQQMSFKNNQLIKNFMYGRFLHQPDTGMEADRAKWAIEIGGASVLEAVFYELSMTIAMQFVNWSKWTLQLCRYVGIDLGKDSAGTPTKMPLNRKALPESKLSAENLEKFDAYAADLAVLLRDKDAPELRMSASFYIEQAKDHLRNIM